MKPVPSSGERDALTPEQTIAAEASAWMARRDRGLSGAERCEFECWRAADARHAREFARLEAAWRGLDRMREVPALEQMAEAVVARAQARRQRTRRAWSFVSLAAAAAVALMLTRGPEAPRPAAIARAPENVRVLASTLARETLPDGSVVELNGTSRIAVEFTPEVRHVRLVAGEAHFVVAKNPARPFLVSAAGVTVRAVGTAFNVRMAPEALEVLVTEGRVSVQNPPASGTAPGEPVALAAGQRAVVPLRVDTVDVVSVRDVSRSEMDDYLAWQSTRLVFDNTSLAEVVDAFNRYNGHVLVLGDPRLANRRLTGVFRADNLDGFVRLLRASADVRSERRGEREVVLLPVE